MRRAIFIFLFLPQTLFAKEVLVLKDNAVEYSFTSYAFYLYEDKKSEMTIDSILNNCCDFTFAETIYPKSENPESSYWMRLDIIDSSSSSNDWIIEFYNSKLDHIEIYTMDNGRLISAVSGDQHSFDTKKILHKNYEFRIPSGFGEKKTLYIKIKTEDSAGMFGVVRKIEWFISYALMEYMYLGLFYGFLCAVLLYNLIIFFYMRSTDYIYYFFYVLSFGIYTAAFDGLGFQFLWPGLPAINNYIQGTAFCSFIVFELLFALKFNHINQRFPGLGKIIAGIIFLRIVYFIVGLSLHQQLLYQMQVDLIPIIVMLIAGIYSYQKGNRISKFFILGVLFFLSGYTVTTLMHFNLVPNTPVTVYAMNIGISLEMIAFSICLAYRFKELQLKKDQAVDMMESKKKELEITHRNREQLEIAVEERTREIQKQKDLIQRRNEDMDTFLYKSSHNLRGPIKSIEGLCMLIDREQDPEQKKSYINLILESAYKLDKDLAQLREVAEINRVDLSFMQENIPQILTGLLQTENNLSSVTYVHNGKDFFTTDKKVFSQAMGNILDASLKLQNIQNIPSAFRVESTADKVGLRIQISIKNVMLTGEWLRDLFRPFNINLKSMSNIDFELYMAKILIEKIQGSLSGELEGEELKFRIQILHP